MAKSPLDELFYEIYGYYPTKAGQAYEILVATALKIMTQEDVKHDIHEKGVFSKTDYQIDGVVPSVAGRDMIEAKDYSLDDRKVGRDDLQKLQGALTDLDFDKGFFASATDFTKPAKKYAESTSQNPLQKQIDLFHIRPSTELDEKGRVKKFIIKLISVTPVFDKGEYRYVWTEDANEKLVANKLEGQQMILDRFYKVDGTLDTLLSQFTYDNQPLLVNMDDEYAKGCWLLHGKYMKIGNELYGLKGIDYKIPYIRSSNTFTVEAEGTPKILIKSEDGKINKLLTDEEFRKVSLD